MKTTCDFDFTDVKGGFIFLIFSTIDELSIIENQYSIKRMSYKLPQVQICSRTSLSRLSIAKWHLSNE